jgi:GNAT superfamily N-acetyltransferase
MTVEIRPLTLNDDRPAFQSGDEALDLYFHRYAGQNQFRHHIGVTYVVVEAGVILGFLTLAPNELAADRMPVRAKAPYPTPVLRVARLATAAPARGRGVGKALLRFAIELAEQLRARIGCVGVVVDAKPGAIAFYRTYGFTEIGMSEGESAVRPRPRAMFLALGSVPRRR